MANKPLSQIILEALTSASSPVQPESVTFDPEIHEIIGDVPLSAQNLCCSGEELLQTAKSLIETINCASAVGDRRQVEQSSCQVELLLEQTAILVQVSYGLFLEYFPEQFQKFNGFVLVEDWKLAGIIQDDYNKGFAAGFMVFLDECMKPQNDASNVHILQTRRH